MMACPTDEAEIGRRGKPPIGFLAADGALMCITNRNWDDESLLNEKNLIL
jgi:hypothetical protein